MDISIVIPLLNEQNSLEELSSSVSSVINDLNLKYEIILIDDGSTDNSWKIISKICTKNQYIKGIRFLKNFGKSLALMQGFDVARGDIAITLDADLQDRPEEIPYFIQKIEEGYDFVNGWRKTRQDTGSKRLVSKLFNGLIDLIFHIQFKDVNCGFKAFTREVYQWVDLKGGLHRLIPVLIAHKGFKVTEIPVVHEERKYGASKYRLLRHRGLLDIIALAASTTTQIRPFHFFCELGAAVWLLAILSFGGWYLGTEFLSQAGQILLLILGLWALTLGTFLPIFGFYLEIEATRYQGPEWRNQLIKESIDLRD